MHRFSSFHHDIYNYDDDLLNRSCSHPNFFHISGDVYLPSAYSPFFESSFCLCLSQHSQTNVPPFPHFHHRTPLWFLSQFNLNFIFSKIKDDFVTRTLNESKSAGRFVSNNEVVYSNNRQYIYLMVQVFIVYLYIITVLVIFEWRQIRSSNQML